MTTKDIAVNGQSFPCPLTWTVEQAEERIRSGYGLQNGFIEEDGVPMLVTALIRDLAGALAFVGGQPIQQLGATAVATPAGYEYRHDWASSVFFLFVEIPIDWNDFTVPELKGFLQSGSIRFTTNKKIRLIALCVANLPTRMKLEISGTAFAITPRRFISCHHCIFDESSSTTLSSVVICSRIIKQGDQIIPDPVLPLLYGDLHCCDANLDFAIFNVRGIGTDLTPIPVCPENLLPSEQTSGVVRIFFCAIGDFQVSPMRHICVWRGGPYSILQYGENANEPPLCRMLLEHGLCRGSSGGALVTDGHVAAMHLASLNQGRSVWRHVRGSTLANSVDESITDMQQIYSAYKEGLVLCRVPAIMNAINNP